MFPLLLSSVFVFGLLIGSFLNVVILRFHTGRSFAGGRSVCLFCNETLQWYALIPLVSFLLQRGKCGYCHARLSIQYPVVELLTAILFVISFWFVGIPTTAIVFFALVYLWVISALLTLITVYDFYHKIIPNAFVYPFIGLSLFSFALTQVIEGSGHWVMFDILAGPILALPLAIFWFVSHGRWMGLGDAKLMFGVGWLLGIWKGFAAFVLSFWVGALFGIALLAFSAMRKLFSGGKQFTMKSEIPFGPFIVFGTLVALFLKIDIFTIASLFL